MTSTSAFRRGCRCRVGGGAVFLWALLAAVPAGGQEKVEVDAAAKLLMGANGMLRQGQAVSGPARATLVAAAAADYEKFLKAYPSHKQAPMARYGLGICRFEQGQYDQAVGLLEKVRAEKPAELADEVLALLGHCYMSQGKHDEALKALDELLRKHPDSKQAQVAMLNRGQILETMARHAEAVTACQAFQKKYPNSPLATSADYTLALAQVSLKQWPEAAGVLVKVLREPNSRVAFSAMLLLGQCHEGMGKSAEAIQQYEAAMRAAPPQRRPEAAYCLGVAQYAAGKYPDAVKTLSSLVADENAAAFLKPARLQLGLAHLAAGKVADARKTLAAVVKDDPQRAAKARYWLAQCDLVEEKYDAARAVLDELARANPKPDNLEAVLYDRAICTMALGRYDDAAGELEAFGKGYPKSAHLADVTYRQAFCLHKLEKYAESLALCRQVAGQTSLPIAPAAAELAAEDLFMLGKYPEAAAAFEALAKAGGSDARKLRIAFRLMQCAYMGGDYAKAIALGSPLADDKDVQRDPKLRRALFFLGDAQLQAGKSREAARTLARYLPLAGEDKAETSFKLGLAQLRNNQQAEAAQTFQALVRQDGKDPWTLRAMYEYAQIAYALKQPDKAEPVLGKLLAANPPEDLAARATYLRAWIDYDAAKYDEAARRFGELVGRFGKHELADDAGYQQGAALVEAGKAKEALAALEAYVKARADGKHVAKAKHQIGRCLAKLGRHPEAAKALAALAGDPKDPAGEELLYELAWAQREAKDPAAAEAYRRLLKEHPSGRLATAARAELAELLYAKGDCAEAARLLEQVVQDAKADPKVLSVAQYRLGWCYDKLDDPAKAAEAFGRFAAKDADSEFAASAMYQAGVAYARLGKTDEAAKQFEALVRRFADHDLAPVAMLKLGEAQAQLQDYDASAKTYADFLKKDPKSKFAYLAHFGIGWAAENRRKYDDARTWYEKVVTEHNGPTAARAQFQTGECWFAEGKFDKAVAELLKVEIVYDYPEWSARALYESGRAFEAMKQPDQAKRQYSVCVQKHKDQPAARLAARRLKEMEEGK